MSLKDVKPGQKFEVPEGVYIGKLYSIVHLGDQETTSFDGTDVVIKEQVALTFELQGTVIEDGPNKGKPLVSTKTYTASLHEKASLVATGILAALLGGGRRAQEILTNEETNLEALLPSLLGKAVQLNIGRGPKSKSNGILNAMPLAAGTSVTPLVNPTILVLDADNVDKATMERLPEFIQKKINSRKLGTAFAGTNTGDNPFVS